MDIGKSFSYVLEDKDWVKKVAIGGVVTIIPILNLVSTGYGLRVLKNVAEERQEPLPEWDDWGGDFVKGLILVVAGLIYALPAIFVSGIGAIVTVVAGDTGGDLEGVAAVLMLGINCLAWIWGVLVGLWTPAAMVNYVSKGEFTAFFEFQRIWELISNNLGAYVTAIVVSIIASIAGSFGTIACVIGVIFTMFYAQIVGMHAYGQFARESGAIVGAGATLDLEPDLSLPGEPLSDL
ncbi:MAG: DUF4013 domain-containing protein [Chloroflexi bacterium]|nr:DUF4013 domain-containing protein [Chloroflexota bacterium]